MIISRDFIYSPKGKNRPLHIYLPDDYQQTDERYPLMYFFDGQNLFSDEDATYGKSWGLRKFLDGWAKKMIVVGIECGHEGEERLSEYLPYPANPGSYFDRFAPMGEATIQWILDEVKPIIDQEYRTFPFRECTGIGGSSMGGLMALYGAIHHNRWFSKAACLSSAIGFCMEPLLRDMRNNPLNPDTRIYLSWGTREARGVKNHDQEDQSSKTYCCNQEVARQILSAGAAARLHCQKGGGHCEADWEQQVPLFMDFLWME